MGATGEIPLKWLPRSVADTFDGEAAQPGAMASLQNLLWDQSTRGALICRPANSLSIDFSTWGAQPGSLDVVTDAYQVGGIIYGIIGVLSGTFAGHDYPFAYDTVAEAFIAVTGITLAKCPTSQATSGAWVPPQFTLTGIDLILTHVGYPGGMGNYFGWFDITTPSSPVWHAGNTSTNALPSVPQCVGTFNNRTYFFCGSVAYYTDTLALSMTNSNQSLQIGDYTPVTCVAPLPQSTTSLGITQGLLCFKLAYLTIITGDAVTSNLGTNEISNSVGTAAPRSAVSTPIGVKFMATDGIRTINFWAQLSEPDADLAMPFIYAVTPSRVAACFNADIYRICTQNGNLPASPYQDYWYDFKRKGWTGPHTFPYDIAVPYLNDFIIASNALPSKMWASYSVQGHEGGGSSFIENGVVLTWAYQTAPMTDLDNIYANALLRSTIELSAPASGQVYTFTAEDEGGTLLAQGSIMQAVNEAVWGSFIWGAANWGAATAGLKPYTIPWNQAAAFNKLTVNGQGQSALGFKIGRLHSAYKRLNYLLN